MILIVVREQDRTNFGYAEDRNDVPPGFLVWAELDTGNWTLTFPDGRSIRYRSFEELHWDLGEAMAGSGAQPREALHQGGERNGVEPVTELAEQWGEMGARVMERVRALESQHSQRDQHPGGRTA